MLRSAVSSRLGVCVFIPPSPPPAAFPAPAAALALVLVRVTVCARSLTLYCCIMYSVYIIYNILRVSPGWVGLGGLGAWVAAADTTRLHVELIPRGQRREAGSGRAGGEGWPGVCVRAVERAPSPCPLGRGDHGSLGSVPRRGKPANGVQLRGLAFRGSLRQGSKGWNRLFTP